MSGQMFMLAVLIGAAGASILHQIVAAKVRTNDNQRHVWVEWHDPRHPEHRDHLRRLNRGERYPSPGPALVRHDGRPV